MLFQKSRCQDLCSDSSSTIPEHPPETQVPCPHCKPPSQAIFSSQTTENRGNWLDSPACKDRKERARYKASPCKASLASFQFLPEGGGLEAEAENWVGVREGDVIPMLVSGRLGLACPNFLAVIF